MTSCGTHIYVFSYTASHDDPGGVPTPDPLGHGVVRLAEPGLVPKRPRDDAGVVLVSLYHALHAPHHPARQDVVHDNEKKKKKQKEAYRATSCDEAGRILLPFS